MKGINKEKIESLQPLQECQPMNQQNKFSPEINKHDISAGSHRTGRAAVALVKFRVLRTVKKEKKKGEEPPSQSRESLAGRPFYGLSAVMKTCREKLTARLWSRTLMPEIYSLVEKSIKMEF